MKYLARLLIVAVLATALQGCFGPFQFTRKIYRWNEDVGEKWANEAVFVGFLIVPVYEIAVLLDLIVFNSIEFWTDKNPIDKDRGSIGP